MERIQIGGRRVVGFGVGDDTGAAANAAFMAIVNKPDQSACPYSLAIVLFQHQYNLGSQPAKLAESGKYDAATDAALRAALPNNNWEALPIAGGPGTADIKVCGEILSSLPTPQDQPPTTTVAPTTPIVAAPVAAPRVPPPPPPIPSPPPQPTDEQKKKDKQKKKDDEFVSTLKTVGYVAAATIATAVVVVAARK